MDSRWSYPRRLFSCFLSIQDYLRRENKFQRIVESKKLWVDLALFRDYLGFIIFNVVHFLIEGKLNEIFSFYLDHAQLRCL